MRHILVTGMPRSGTTPVGEMLTKSSHWPELYEPLSNAVGDRRVQNWFIFTNELMQSEHLLEDIIAGRIQPSRRKETRKKRGVLNRTSFSCLRRRYLPSFAEGIVWKDPFAFFLLPELTVEPQVSSLVTVRAPIEACGSFSRMNWALDINDLRRRAVEAGIDLPNTHYSSAPVSPATSAAELWHLMHTVLLSWLRENMRVTVIDTGENLRAPYQFAEKLSHFSGLDITAQKLTDSPNSKKLPDKAHIRKRSKDSISNLWKNQLSKVEIDYCHALNNDLWMELQPYFWREF